MSDKILLVADDYISIMVLKKILQQRQDTREVISFHTGQQALKYLNGDNGYDNNHYLMFLDLDMPIVQALAFLDQILGKQQHYNFQVVIINSSVKPSDRQKAKKYEHVVEFIEKPLDEKKFSVIRHFLSKDYN